MGAASPRRQFAPGRDGSVRPLLFLAVGFALLLLSAGATLFLAERQQAVFADVQATLESEALLDRIQTLITDAETAQRGYLLTGRSEYLRPLDLALQQIGPAISSLARQPMAADPIRQRYISLLGQLTMRKLSELQRTIDLRAAGRLNDALEILSNDISVQQMIQIRRTLADMRANGRQFLQQREARLQNTRRAAELVLTLCIVLVIALALLAFTDTKRRIVKLQTTNEQLTHEMEVRHSAEAELRQLQKMEAIGQLTGGIAHDFNNMLAVIMGSLDLARRKITDAPQVSKYIENAIEGAQRAAKLTNQLLAFSRQQALEPKAIDLNQLINGISELIRRTIGESIQIELALAGGVWPVFVDPTQLENVLVNLAVNARDAMPDGGKITIETANTRLDERYAEENDGVTPGEYTMICFADTGIGMPPEVLNRAFDPFFTTKERGKGTGLGLSQVFGFVKQSGGHVKLWSEARHGTVIKIYLPRYRGEDSPADTGRAAALPQGKPAETVLVVDDDSAVGRVTVENLQELGYSVVQATTPCEALHRIEGEPKIDLLFTDVVMPEMNGRELAEQARARRPKIKVLYASGYTRNSIVHDGRLDAHANLLAKPFTLEQLAAKVRQTLDAA